MVTSPGSRRLRPLGEAADDLAVLFLDQKALKESTVSLARVEAEIVFDYYGQ